MIYVVMLGMMAIGLVLLFVILDILDDIKRATDTTNELLQTQIDDELRNRTRETRGAAEFDV